MHLPGLGRALARRRFCLTPSRFCHFAALAGEKLSKKLLKLVAWIREDEVTAVHRKVARVIPMLRECPLDSTGRFSRLANDPAM